MNLPCVVRSASLDFALFALLFASCGGGGGGGGGPTARFLVAAQGSADFNTSTQIEGVCPAELDFSIFLEAGGHGWISLEHSAFGAVVVEVTWTGSGDEYEVVAPEVRVAALFQEDPYFLARVGWEDLSLVVRDDDGDGAAEAGDASATLICDWEIALNARTERFDSRFELHGEQTPAALSIRGDGLEPMSQAVSLEIQTSRPLLAETIPGDAKLLVDGEPVAATIAATDVEGPFAGGLRIEPAELLPFNASLTIAPGSIVDAFDKPASFDGIDYHTVADPGPLSDNPSFENQGGWIGLHTTGANDDFPEIDGPTHAYVTYDYLRDEPGDDLVGYFDVPEDATTLSVEVGFEDYNEDCDHSLFWLTTSHGRQSLLPDVQDVPECGDYPYGCTISWRTTTADLTAARGERVVLKAIPAGFTECRPDVFDKLHIDDIRVE